jgi:hypothetical protein
LGRILVEVVAPMVGDLRQCTYCESLLGQTGIGQRVHGEFQAQVPPELREDSERLSAWLLSLAQRFGGRLSIRVIDPQSFLGFCMSVRHWVRSYATFIVAGRQRLAGWDRDALDRMLVDLISEQYPGVRFGPSRELDAGLPGRQESY